MDLDLERKFLVRDVDLRTVPTTVGKEDHPGRMCRLRRKLRNITSREGEKQERHQQPGSRGEESVREPRAIGWDEVAFGSSLVTNLRTSVQQHEPDWTGPRWEAKKALSRRESIKSSMPKR